MHNPRCTIPDPEHGGPCDARPEAERWRELRALLDARATDAEMERAIAASALASWGAS
jgi:hypothetical protein